MSSKTAGKKEGPGRPASLAARMTLLYSLSAFLLVLMASGFLYQALSHSLFHEDDELLSQKLQNLTTRLRDPTVDLNDLQEFVGELPVWYRNTSFWTRILDGQGRLLTETPGMSRSLPLPLFKEGYPNGWNSTVHSQEGRPFRVSSTQGLWLGHSPPSVTIQMAFDIGPDEAILRKFRKKLLAVLGFALLACALGGYWIAKRGIRPVRKMAGTAARISPSTLNERLERSGLPSELSDLAATFNGMLDRLEDSFVRLSRFSSDIAHELRTPLQNLRGEAEVVLSKEREPGEYREILGSALEEYQRLSNLIDRLLFLARAENPQTQIQREELDLKKELGLLQDFYGLSAGESGIALRVEAPEGLRADLDRSLFQRAVGNLVENALKHTPAGGTVLLKTSNGDGKVRVEISDTGKGIPPDQVSRVFDRFYRVDPSRSPSSGGAGLGLSIVKSIMDLHAGTVEIRSEPSKGTTVTLLFPPVHRS
jgi:two-component system, OmpR family, heavy metal sensor histidine kinase CusS